MKNETTIVQDEMRFLISRSCEGEPKNNTDCYQFQKALLKHFFQVADVIIDYEKEVIILWKASRKDPQMIYSLAEASVSKIRYTNLEETLMGCLETGEGNLRQYRSFLKQYRYLVKNVVASKSA